MTEPKKAISKRARWFAIAVAFGLLLGLLVLLLYYFGVYRLNQKIQQRASLPPHEVPFQRLLSLPNGESRIEGEQIIIEVFLITPNRLGANTSSWVFDLSDYPGRGYLSNPPRANIIRCNEVIKTNCFDVTLGAIDEIRPQQFLGIHVATDSGADIPFAERVRLHGKLSMKNEKSGDQTRLDSLIAVTRIEKPR